MTARKNTVPIKFVGWIYGNLDDREALVNLGVGGEMKWRLDDNSRSATPGASEKAGIFEHCIITTETAKKLRDNYPVFTPETFTGIDADGNQTKHQPLWEGVYE